MERFRIAGLLLAASAFAFAAPPAVENAPKRVGTVANVELEDKDLSKKHDDRLHFCVFENGEEDYIYVGTRYGTWSNGEFDLSINGKWVFTGRVPHLGYSGTIIHMGNVLDGQPRSKNGFHVTRITGIFK